MVYIMVYLILYIMIYIMLYAMVYNLIYIPWYIQVENLERLLNAGFGTAPQKSMSSTASTSGCGSMGGVSLARSLWKKLSRGVGRD
jgi:hypothetical protein